MKTFLAQCAAEIKGTLSGFDRIRFRGTIRWLASMRGMLSYLCTVGVLLKDFKEWAMAKTDAIKAATRALAAKHGRPLLHLKSCHTIKEDLVREIAERDGIRNGLICVLSCTESCQTFLVGPNGDTKLLELRPHPGRCLHYYFYYQHPVYGLMHLRLQTWLPFTIHVCMNGREWLARRLVAEGIAFEKRDNCFVDLGDVALAQLLMDEQVLTDWEKLLNGLVQESHPAHTGLFPEPMHYYWSAEETEWATDVMFRSRQKLAQLHRLLVRHAITTFGCEQVLRFLGRCPNVRQYKATEIVSTLKTRPEGTCVKHSINRNSVKMYDKQESVLRVETTVNDARDMKSYRAAEGSPTGEKKWRRLRKGVADLPRRAEVSQKSNERYLESLAAVSTAEPLEKLVRSVCRPVPEWQGGRVRALEPLGEQDGELLAAIARGEFAVNGFRNRDIRALLYPQTPAHSAEGKRQSARVTRLLRLLRGHKLIQKVANTHRYQMTKSGRKIVTALLVTKQATVQQLAQLAA